jgi:hypothetical protein
LNYSFSRIGNGKYAKLEFIIKPRVLDERRKKKSKNLSFGIKMYIIKQSRGGSVDQSTHSLKHQKNTTTSTENR